MLDQWKKRKDNTWLRTYYEWRDRQARHITVIYSISVCFHDLQKRFSNNLNTHFRCWLIFTTSQQHSLSFSLIHCYSCYYYSPIKWIRLSSLLRSRSLIHSLSLSLSTTLSVCHHAFAAQWVEWRWKCDACWASETRGKNSVERKLLTFR